MPGTVTHADVSDASVLARRRRGSLRPRPRPTTTRHNPISRPPPPPRYTRPHHAPLNSFVAHARASPGQLWGLIPRIPATLSAWRTRRCFFNRVWHRSSACFVCCLQCVVVYLCNARRCTPSRYTNAVPRGGPYPLVRAWSWSCLCACRSCWVGCSSRCPRYPVSAFGTMPCVRGVWWLCVCRKFVSWQFAIWKVLIPPRFACNCAAIFGHIGGACLPSHERRCCLV